ncbi:hypothetical protein [Chryseobacterium nepalense]|jgi:hypothetical protein|uniref:Anti-sigma factor n=1 Tax=Chryseobacterium nepalense TaxID=1854498 RepID=A0ABY4K1F4_9FLAO|nr:hypothetical protein [Chryseobacterium nepalense]UPQ74628.1 hypothetical protein M0D58_11250 [Chryseobacterium nepalense]
MKEFDIEKLERKNIYTVPENLFENIQGKVLSGLNDFDLEKLERKNIYTVSENMYDDVQNHVINKVISRRQAPVFRLNWAYAVAASLALIFGATFVFTSDNEATKANGDENVTYAVNEPKTESEIAYETLQSDLTSVENNDQKVVAQNDNKSIAKKETGKQQKTEAQPVKSASKKQETQMNEYLDSFTSSEISELASNSTQDVYLDLYN